MSLQGLFPKKGPKRPSVETPSQVDVVPIVDGCIWEEGLKAIEAQIEANRKGADRSRDRSESGRNW